MIVKNWLRRIIGLFHAVKDEKLRWQTDNQARELQLKHQQILAENQLAAELKKKSVQLAHEIKLLETKNTAELTMLKIKCQQDIKDYKQYLAALDKLKESIQTSYTHLPEAVAFTIHHHAQHLLNQMWEASNFADKMHHEMRLIQFMTTVHEDASAYLQGDVIEKLPKRTLNLIQQQ